MTLKEDPRSSESDTSLPAQSWFVSNRALVVDENGGLEERSVAVGIHAGVINAILPAEEVRRGEVGDRARARGSLIDDVGESPIVPSFVNAHSHLSLGVLRGVASLAARSKNVVTDVFFQVEKHLTAADVRAFTRLGAVESLLAGVGEVWDHYYFGEAVAEALGEVGLPGVVAPTLQDLGGPFRFAHEVQLEATRAIATANRYRASHVRAALGPHASDTVSDELFERSRALALELDLPVHLHLSQSVEEARLGEERFVPGMGEAMLERLKDCRVLCVHGLYLDDADCARLARAGWVLGYTPYSQLQFGFLGPFGSWHRAGGAWAVGTDCVASNDGLDVQRELPLIGGQAALEASFSQARERSLVNGFTPALREEVDEVRKKALLDCPVGEPEVLLKGALGRSLHRLEAPGTASTRGIEVGALASFHVLQKEHPVLFPGGSLARSLAYAPTSSAIEFSVVAGRVIGRTRGLRDELLKNEAYSEMRREASQRRDELFARAQIPLAL